MYSIEMTSLSKKFGSLFVIDDITLQVKKNEIFGFLGPNGAGKSTTMMILATLLKPTSGIVTINGFNIVSQPGKVREHIGYVQQEITVDEYLTGRENLILQSRLNHIPKNVAKERIDEILKLIELENKQNDLVITYSGGMRKRLDIAGSLLHKPKVLFLDEPTVGLDIQTRKKIWEHIKKIRSNFKTTIFLSTHYMEEADELCDRVAIIEKGKIKVIDSPITLKKKFGSEILSIITETNIESIKSAPEIVHIKKNVNEMIVKNKTIKISSTNCTKILPLLIKSLLKLEIEINSISMYQPTLNDVFIKYTGNTIDQENITYNMKREYRRLKNIKK